MRSSLAVMPTTQFLVNDREPAPVSAARSRYSTRTVSEETDRLEEVLDQDGLEHVKLLRVSVILRKRRDEPRIDR